ncbi:hypothetical protein DPMN_037658 [Dreissena polymorpha]|uniref:Uncharacterized protein n=1 Tax=Dreissena polymorpha TaxID=45954 RepID=A0A9D4MBR5_DREPO|nr:hypothetical protein DPMN_037658 [Dreissena polymorpha]
MKMIRPHGGCLSLLLAGDKGKVLLQNKVVFSWSSPSYVEVKLHDNGSHVTLRQLVYIVE